MQSIGLLGRLGTVINGEETLTEARFREESFTRKRGMPFPHALHFMLDMRTTTIQTRLNAFFKHNGGGTAISQQAFSKLRANFDHSPFEKMIRDIYDVLHGWALDPIITDAYMNERTQCEKHIDFLCRELPDIAQKSILLGDRGYPSMTLFRKLEKSGMKFVARCKSNFAKAVSSAPTGDSIVLLKNGLSVRIIKFKLKNGDVETLATNLFDISMDAIIELYTLRWGMETMYFNLKEKLSVEKFSGKTANSIRQDFWASMVLLNSVAVFQHEADEAVIERQKNKPLKHRNRARTSTIVVTLRDRFIFASLSANADLAKQEVLDIVKLVARDTSPVRPGRSYQRDFKPFYKVNHNLKSRL